MSRIAVIIPCYNEGLTIADTVKQWKAALPEATIYVYDNHSTDDTPEKAMTAGAKLGYEGLQGKGNVVRRMLKEIEADCYIMVDGDNTYSAEKAQEMVDSILTGEIDLVIGDRLSSTYFSENKRRFHGVGNRFVRYLINSLYHGQIQDALSGCRAMSCKFAKAFPCESTGFEIEVEMDIFALKNQCKIKNIPVTYQDRPEGSKSKLNTIRDGVKITRFVMSKLKKN